VVHQHLEYNIKSTTHKDLTSSRITRVENDITEILSVLRETFVDPFSNQSIYCLLSTGIAVEEKSVVHFLNALKIGESSMNSLRSD
jgi:hypothetical protein